MTLPTRVKCSYLELPLTLGIINYRVNYVIYSRNFEQRVHLAQHILIILGRITQYNLQENIIVLLTPPTLSKCSDSRSKSISWPLKAQEKLMSSAGSTVTWQGSTMLSPTIISMLLGPCVILLGSAQHKHSHLISVLRLIPLSHHDVVCCFPITVYTLTKS